MILLVLGYVLIAVSLLALLGVVRIFVASSRSARKLRAAGNEEPLAVDHLPSGLRRFAADTRLLRTGLEGPLAAIQEHRRRSFDRAMEDVESLDADLTYVEREVRQWLDTFARLEETEKERFEDLGIDSGKLRALLADDRIFDRDSLLARDGTTHRRFERLVSAMREVETALQATGRIYR